MLPASLVNKHAGSHGGRQARKSSTFGMTSPMLQQTTPSWNSHPMAPEEELCWSLLLVLFRHYGLTRRGPRDVQTPSLNHSDEPTWPFCSSWPQAALEPVSL
mmetsp:Transcript_11247/g.34656  ORF Transcript_11247/g.34656 Transcript_11247/m.34656 type:complete len:102 (-) Transcript_11247:552-857(-)